MMTTEQRRLAEDHYDPALEPDQTGGICDFDAWVADTARRAAERD